MWLKQSTTTTLSIGPFLDKTDGVSPEVGLGAMGVEISKNGGAYGARSDATATAHQSEGFYSCVLNATDTGTLGRGKLKAIDSATHLPVWHDFMVVTANVWDSLFGADKLKVHTDEFTGGLLSGETVAAVSGSVGSVTGAVGSLGATAKTDVNAECDTAITDAALATAAAVADVPTVAEFNARTVTSATYGTAANQTTILNRLGDFAGSGLNTIKGWFQALFRKDAGVSGANLPSEINEVENATAGNYDATTDSQEAIRDTAPLGTAMRGTDSAALASVCTEGRLAKNDSLAFNGTDLHVDVKKWKAAAPNDLNAGRVSAREQPTEEGTAQAGASLSITLRAGASSITNDPLLSAHMVRIVAGTGVGQRRFSNNYNGTTKVLDVGSVWATTPDVTSVYEILEANFVDANLEAWRQVDVPVQTQSSGHVGVSPPVIVVDIDDGGIDPVSGLYDIGDNAVAGRILGIIGAKKNFDDLNDPTTAAIVTAVLTTVMTESYAADGATMTLAQAQHLILALVGEFSVSDTVLTAKKLDGATPAATYTLDDATNPTSRTRAT